MSRFKEKNLNLPYFQIKDSLPKEIHHRIPIFAFVEWGCRMGVNDRLFRNYEEEHNDMGIMSNRAMGGVMLLSSRQTTPFLAVQEIEIWPVAGTHITL